MRARSWGLGILLLSISVLGFADRGMIPLEPGIFVYEPGQKAIIAWDSGREILILSTDARASGQTRVLEILPLPSEPKVSLGKFEAFERIQQLIMDHRPQGSLYRGVPLTPGMEILFHQRLGAHDLTVTRVEDYQQFIAWLQNFVGKRGLNLPPSLGEVVTSYVSAGYKYFAIDLIDLSQEERSIEPLIYEFATPYIYFPLKISSIIPGKTKIQLFLITAEPLALLQKYGMLELAYYAEPAYPIFFPFWHEELVQLEPKLAGLFSQSYLWLAALKYEGPLAGLASDLRLLPSGKALAEIIIEPPEPTPEDNITVKVRVIFPEEFGNECEAMAHISKPVRFRNTFTITAGERDPDIICILIYAPTNIGERSFNLGRLPAGKYLIEVRYLSKVIASRSFQVQRLRIGQVKVYFNPNNGSVRFVVNDEVSAIKLEVFDLSGRRVFDSRPRVGPVLEWSGLNAHGMALANGIYLYRIAFQARGWKSSKLGKLVILR